MDVTQNILLTTNEAFAQHCAVCISSLSINNATSNFLVTIASLSLQKSTKEKLRSLEQQFTNIKIRIVDFPAEQLESFPQIGSYSKDIYLRLWVDTFYPENLPSRVLYLDADTIVVGSLDEIWAIDMQDNIIAAVDIPDAQNHERCKLFVDGSYFNSGVLLFNVPLWKKEQCLQQINDFLNDNADIALNPDQDALNALYHHRRITLSGIYNATSPFFRKQGFSSLSDEVLKDIRDNVKIVHFNGRARPWMYGCNHPYQKKYLAYQRKTPWADSQLIGKSFFKQLKRRVSLLLGKDSFVKLNKNAINGK